MWHNPIRCLWYRSVQVKGRGSVEIPIARYGFVVWCGGCEKERQRPEEFEVWKRRYVDGDW